MPTCAATDVGVEKDDAAFALGQCGEPIVVRARRPAGDVGPQQRPSAIMSDERGAIGADEAVGVEEAVEETSTVPGGWRARELPVEVKPAASGGWKGKMVPRTRR